jgi:hypothetical protein
MSMQMLAPTISIRSRLNEPVTCRQTDQRPGVRTSTRIRAPLPGDMLREIRPLGCFGWRDGFGRSACRCGMSRHW